MLCLYFDNTHDYDYYASVLNKPLTIDDIGTLYLHVHEVDLVDNIRRFFSVVRLKYTQWFQVKAFKVSPIMKISRIDEYTCIHQTINPLSDAFMIQWKVPMRVVSYDIEAYNSNKKAV